jgi:transcriptional regulator with XRE-family HTH domain
MCWLTAVEAAVKNATRVCLNGELTERSWQMPSDLPGPALCFCRFDVMRMPPTESAVTAVSATGGPTVRRRQLGALLRKLRKSRGWTAEQVADRLYFDPSKLSRLETGRRRASEQDINSLCKLYEVDDEQRQHLLELARLGKQRAWWQPLGLPYSLYVELEEQAASILDYGLVVIPGLLQTPDYARAVLRGVVPELLPEVVEQRVEARITRQRLLTSEDRPHFEAVIDESVLHRVVGSHAIMQAQFDQLLYLSGLPNVTVRVVSYDAGVLPASNNKFIILKFADPEVHDVVYVEGLTGDLYLEDDRDVRIYNLTFRALVQRAATPEATCEIISELLDK